MRHFEMAYATLFIETLILYTVWWHDQPHFVYRSMYFDIYLCNLSMDTCILIYIFVIYVHNDIHINFVLVLFNLSWIMCIVHVYGISFILIMFVIFDSNAIICE